MPQKNTHLSSKKIFVVIGIIVVIVAIIFALSRKNDTANIELPTSTASVSEVSSTVSDSENSQRLKKEHPDIFNRYSKNVSSRRFTIVHAA